MQKKELAKILLCHRKVKSEQNYKLNAFLTIFPIIISLSIQ